MSQSPIKDIRWKDRTAIVDLAGEIDLNVSTALQEGLMDVLQENPKRIAVNLSQVPYMDSSGVASLVKLLSRAKAHQVDLVLVAPSPKVKSVLEITRLNTVFGMADSEDDL